MNQSDLPFDSEETVRRARNRVMASRFMPAGDTCPCCDQFVKAYPRPITSTMARWLIGLVRRWELEDRFYSTSEAWSLRINRGTGDIAKLRYWGLAYTEPLPAGETRKRCSGNWKPTPDGIAFVYRKKSVPRRLWVYNSEIVCDDSDEERIDIVRALSKKFDYGELMRNEL